MRQNVGTAERIITGVAAAGLAAFAVKKASSTPGKLAAGLASALLSTRAATGYCPAKDAAQLATSDDAHAAGERGIRVEQSTVINAPVEKVFEFWENVENFPKFMNHLQKVTKTSDKTSHWVSDGPLGTSVEWDAEEVKHVKNDVIAWRSVSGGVANSGTVRFRGVGPKTRIRVKMEYTPPAGTVGATVAKFFGEDPKTQLKEYLAKAKSILEGGKDAEQAA